MKKLLVKAAALGLIGAFLLAGCGKSGENQEAASGQAGRQKESAGTQGSQEQEELLTGKHHVNINIKDKGTIAVELDADSAPITVTNFVNLAKSGFYDGLTFHRIIEGFMMQGGDPDGDGTGGSENKIKGEFANNGIENPLSHVRGAISMARSQIKDSASSQFFIVHEDSLFLDGDYAVFGYVTEGMEIVDDICSNATGQDENGVLPVGNRPVIESIEVVD
ncbi:MAG: peptidylprolyl isomerase [Lachnoclostridium sp.]|nr:peptidylprolyl isomerase [Lachnoclostridium sp.]MCM1384282.1 peptidylprolyl isomerase [Lachnoclostridium sp.]